MMTPAQVVRRKREGEELAPSDIRAFFQGYAHGAVEEYQMSAFLMAVYFRGMSATELAALVEVMLDSGAVAELSALREAAAGQRTSTAGLQSETDKVDLIPIDRKIRLGGVFKRDDSDFWILWMNGHKLHPGYLFPEIQKIKVEKEEVYLEWYDIGLNDVIKLTMRPNQVYDIVTGILYNDTAGGR